MATGPIDSLSRERPRAAGKESDSSPPLRWSAVAENVFCPAAAAWDERRLSLFMRGPRGEVLYRRRDERTWGEIRNLGPAVARLEGTNTLTPVEWPISACSTGDDEIHLLARGAEGELVHGTMR